MDWNNGAERLALIERVGIDAYNAMLKAHHAETPAIYPVTTRFGLLWAIKGTPYAFATREQAEEHMLAAQLDRDEVPMDAKGARG